MAKSGEDEVSAKEGNFGVPVLTGGFQAKDKDIFSALTSVAARQLCIELSSCLDSR